MTYGAGGYGHKAERTKGVTHWKQPRDDTPRVTTAPGDVYQDAQVQDLGPWYIQGRKVQSSLEWRIYRMLKLLRWTDDRIQYQADMLGGHLPGGVFLDFVVETYGIPTVVEPNGDHWHTGSKIKAERDRERYQRIANAYRRPFKYFAYTEGQILTDEMAYLRLLLDVGRG